MADIAYDVKKDGTGIEAFDPAWAANAESEIGKIRATMALHFVDVQNRSST